MNNCQNCKYWDPVAFGSPSSPNGLCRIAPPAVSFSPGGRPMGTSWPTTQSDDWCGEWQATPGATPA